MNKNKIISISISYNLLSKFDKLADVSEKSRSQMIKDLILNEVEKNELFLDDSIDIKERAYLWKQLDLFDQNESQQHPKIYRVYQ